MTELPLKPKNTSEVERAVGEAVGAIFSDMTVGKFLLITLVGSVLVFVIFWYVLPVLAAILAAFVPEQCEPGFRDGPQGYGYYQCR